MTRSKKGGADGVTQDEGAIEAQPPHGGSFMRNVDGSLTLVETTDVDLVTGQDADQGDPGSTQDEEA